MSLAPAQPACYREVVPGDAQRSPIASALKAGLDTRGVIQGESQFAVPSTSESDDLGVHTPYLQHGIGVETLL